MNLWSSINKYVIISIIVKIIGGMLMGGIKIITDSCSDLPKEILENYNIGVVPPLEIRFDDKSYLDGVELTNMEFYSMMKEHEKLPKTASPSPEQFIREFEKN